jgi:hypothetical protein
MFVYKRWEIWWAWFEYENHEGCKRRPVLIISPTEAYILSAIIYAEIATISWTRYNAEIEKALGGHVPPALVPTAGGGAEGFQLLSGSGTE